ncbi:MAG: HAMP domain-containing histidine kinase [Desulfobacterales bacterium]|nr:HAMP domain-containing histidine kinase [Desulfobacterales bacterium]MCP4159491.1 HAMP domain-containing histidine kinase [Deltaproteobacteria bacterium]
MNRVKYVILISLVITISALHYFTPGNLMFLHNLYSKLSYFPIVLGAVFFGIRGGLIFAILTTLGFTPHLIIYKGLGEDVYLSQFIEIGLYFSIALIVGFISGKETSLKKKYKKISEELNISYKRLHEETELLIDIEERLRKNQKLSALGELAASIAHEIKNPLASIKGVSEIISDEFRDDHPKKSFMDIMEKEITRLDSTVSDMLQNFAGKEEYSEKELKSFQEIIDSITSLLDERINGKKAIVKFDIDDTIDLLDSKRCYQIFFNLILNAIDAIDDEGEIKISSKKEVDNLIFSIDDNGPGVSDDQREEVFKPFYTAKKGGTGLGLSICRKIAESLNGTITINESQLGGASFKVTLPVK